MSHFWSFLTIFEGPGPVLFMFFSYFQLYEGSIEHFECVILVFFSFLVIFEVFTLQNKKHVFHEIFMVGTLVIFDANLTKWVKSPWRHLTGRVIFDHFETRFFELFFKTVKRPETLEGPKNQ